MSSKTDCKQIAAQTAKENKIKRKRCYGCHTLYEPKNSKDKLCDVWKYYLQALNEQNLLNVESLRKEYIKQYGKQISYGKFIAMLEEIKQRLKYDSKEGKKDTTL